jgi:hypothetical protein
MFFFLPSSSFPPTFLVSPFYFHFPTQFHMREKCDTCLYRTGLFDLAHVMNDTDMSQGQ